MNGRRNGPLTESPVAKVIEVIPLVGTQANGALVNSNKGNVATSSAFRRLSRPPVTHLPARLGRGSTELRMRATICCAVSLGKRARSNAAAPATMGVAMDE